MRTKRTSALGTQTAPAVRPMSDPYSATREGIVADEVKRMHRRVVGKAKLGTRSLLRGMAS